MQDKPLVVKAEDIDITEPKAVAKKVDSISAKSTQDNFKVKNLIAYWESR